MAKTEIKKGDRFYRIEVIKEISRHKTPGGTFRRRYLCKCDCGKIWPVCMTELKNGDTKSCGCLRLDRDIKRLTKHGKCRTRIYKTWCNMKNRCNNPKNKEFKNYGDRGIKLCDKWYTFEGFWEDMKEGYSDNLTIDRINNNGNYEKENCQWSTHKEQANNKRNNKFLTLNNETKSITIWANELGLKYTTLYMRLRNGFSVQKALQK